MTTRTTRLTRSRARGGLMAAMRRRLTPCPEMARRPARAPTRAPNAPNCRRRRRPRRRRRFWCLKRRRSHRPVRPSPTTHPIKSAGTNSLRASVDGENARRSDQQGCSDGRILTGNGAQPCRARLAAPYGFAHSCGGLGRRKLDEEALCRRRRSGAQRHKNHAVGALEVRFESGDQVRRSRG